MSKKSILGLLLFACLVVAALFAGASYFISLEDGSYKQQEQKTDATKDMTAQITSGVESEGATLAAEGSPGNTKEAELVQDDAAQGGADVLTEEPWLSTNPSDQGAASEENSSTQPLTAVGSDSDDKNSEDTFSTSVPAAEAPQLIYDSDKVDYMSYIPEISMDSDLEGAFDITNPSIDVDATSAILFDADTKEILYYKNALEAVFPASTAKLLTALVALDWCTEDEEVTVGDEITMIGTGSTIAYLRQGQVLTIRNLLCGMLLPSGNDAAYAIAAYVGRKSLQNETATKEEAIAEFGRLMNLEAKTLGVKNSCFKSPDGYDAIGQYTTAYDMGLIGAAAASNETIVEVCDQADSRNIFPSGEDVTWYNTNKLIKRGYAQYYSKAIGLKTGTSTMAGRCLIAAAEEDGRKVVCAIMNSSSSGRWDDAIKLLKYGLNN